MWLKHSAAPENKRQVLLGGRHFFNISTQIVKENSVPVQVHVFFFNWKYNDKLQIIRMSKVNIYD